MPRLVLLVTEVDRANYRKHFRGKVSSVTSVPRGTTKVHLHWVKRVVYMLKRVQSNRKVGPFEKSYRIHEVQFHLALGR